MSKPYIDVDAPVQNLDCNNAWSNLTTQEKHYAYYFAKACWEGSKICWFQRSYESPGLYLMLSELFKDSGVETKAKSAGLDDLEWRQFLAYAAGVFANMGNYRSFGDTKIIPEVAQEKFDLVINSSDNERVKDIYGRIREIIYNNEAQYQNLNFPDLGGISSYYSRDVTSQEANLVKEFLQSVNLTDQHINSRLWKVGDVLEVRIASLPNNTLPFLGDYEYNGRKIRIVNGDYSAFVQRLSHNLLQTLPYVANETQQNMILKYLNHFTTGDINVHKDSQRFWIKDLGPVIETNLGFIETYVDPLGIRAEFEGFVSVVDKEVSAKFAKLVEQAAEIIAKLPWGQEFEKDTFTPPDFTSLDVLAFATAGVPIGINIPNYDDIRTTEGFKNVNLGNAYPKVTPSNLQFLKEDDVQLVLDMFHDGETIMVALHELLGHGSGKLLIKNTDGSFNFNTEAINPATGEKIDSWYEADQTWSSKFAELSNAYEECRAETVATFLSCQPEPYQIFGVENSEKCRNMIWLYMCYQGIKALQFYSREATKWGQAHCRARFAIFKVMLEAEDNFLTIDFKDNDFVVNMDYDKIPTSGLAAISDFLTKLHCFKATGDLARGRELFERYSAVDEIGLRLQEIILANQKPRRMNVQPHLEYRDGQPQLVNFEESFEGIIQSYLARYPEFDQEMYDLWVREFA